MVILRSRLSRLGEAILSGIQQQSRDSFKLGSRFSRQGVGRARLRPTVLRKKKRILTRRSKDPRVWLPEQCQWQCSETHSR